MSPRENDGVNRREGNSGGTNFSDRNEGRNRFGKATSSGSKHGSRTYRGGDEDKGDLRFRNNSRDGSFKHDPKTYGRGQRNKSAQRRALTAREASFNILFDFHTKRADLEQIIDREFDNSFVNVRDKRLAFNISYGVLRNRSYLDFINGSSLVEGTVLK